MSKSKFLQTRNNFNEVFSPILQPVHVLNVMKTYVYRVGKQDGWNTIKRLILSDEIHLAQVKKFCRKVDVQFIWYIQEKSLMGQN